MGKKIKMPPLPECFAGVKEKTHRKQIKTYLQKRHQSRPPRTQSHRQTKTGDKGVQQKIPRKVPVRPHRRLTQQQPFDNKHRRQNMRQRQW